MSSVRKYTAIMKVTMADSLVYFWNYLGNNLFFVFIMFVYFMLWRNIFASKGALIAGLSLNGMIWYLVVTELITLSRPNVHLQVNKEVKDGSIAYLLTKPYHYVLYNFATFIGEAGVKLLTNGLSGLFIGFLMVGPLVGFSMGHLPMVVVSILLGCILNFFIYITLALSAFWLEENQALFWIYSKLVFTLGGMLVPIDLFPSWLQVVSKYMPFAYVTYVPARIAVDFNQATYLQQIGGQVVYILIFFLVAMTMYRKGARALNVNGG